MYSDEKIAKELNHFFDSYDIDLPLKDKMGLSNYFKKCKSIEVIDQIMKGSNKDVIVKYIDYLNQDEIRNTINSIYNIIDKENLEEEINNLNIKPKFLHKPIRLMVYGQESGADWVSLYQSLGNIFRERFKESYKNISEVNGEN